MLTVVNSTFRENAAGLVSFAGQDEDEVEGAGGGIAAKDSTVLVEGCLFDTCYASKKGGGLLQESGQLSVVGSLFFNNTAGSDNQDSEDAIGEGGAVAMTACTHSSDTPAAAVAPCEFRDTVFLDNSVAEKGGALAIASGDDDDRPTVELDGCVVRNNTAGKALSDDPQGEGGAIVVGAGCALLLSDCLLEKNWAGKKGGVINLSGGEDWDDDPGAVLIVQDSSFVFNTALLNTAGGVTMNQFTNTTIVGQGNVFYGNRCALGGAAIGADYNSIITVEGGTFIGNEADMETEEEVWQKGEQSGGVLWTRGEISVLGGHFSNNSAKNGGVIQGSLNSTVVVEGGTFENNVAENGGVIYVVEDGSLVFNGGLLQGNSASNGGGAFFAESGADIEITGGNFISNKADFGGFLYKAGEGNATCSGATVLQHEGIDGGAIYAIDGANLEWACHIRENSALIGPAIYARDNAVVALRGVEVSDNFVTRGSAIFLVNSTFITSQVVVNDTSENSDLSAVQTDALSTYTAQDTCFVGFAGEVVVYSEGELYLDECDFSGSSSAVLVYAELEDATVIRNAVLGANNYETIAEDASEMLQLPSADSFINLNLTCNSSSAVSPCGVGSWCLEGDLGVYCEHYQLRSTLEEVCASGDVDALTLTLIEDTESQPTFYPSLLERELQLSFAPSNATNADDDDIATSSRSCVGASRVAWSVSGLWPSSEEEQDDWTVFPSTGLLLPGESVRLRLVSQPNDAFNGLANITVRANDITALSTTASILASNTEPQSEGGDVTVGVEYYFCDEGNFWNSSVSGADLDPTVACTLCTESIDGAIEGVDCASAGATTTELPIKAGYWRANVTSLTIRECFNEGACKGGTTVAEVQEYCNEGYVGPQCAVCETGFGKGMADECHSCTAGFKGGMYFLLAVVLLAMVVVVVLLAIYLVGGKSAVSSTVVNTKESALRIQHRGSVLLTRSVDNARPDFGGLSDGPPIGGSAVSTNSPGTEHKAAPPEVSAGQSRGQGNSRAGNDKDDDASPRRVANLLTALPLSKLKIVIDITKAPFPPIYEKFLSIIGIFSFDLGWILSAACLTTGIDFYDKLLMVTIGPLLPLCFLGITFFVGSRPAKKTNMSPNTTAGGGATSGSRVGEVEEGRVQGASSRSMASVMAIGGATARAQSVRNLLRAKSGQQKNPEQERLWGLFARHTTIMLIVLYLVYTQISTVVFQTFSCEDLPEIGKSYLRADFRIECDTQRHTLYKAYAGVMICIYPLGIPAIFFYFLVRQRSRINPPTDEALKKRRGGRHVAEQKMTVRDQDQSIAPTSFLWSAYFPTCYYYEVFECIRRLLLTGILVFLVPDTPGQVAFSCIFAIVSLMVFELLRPHVNNLDRQLYRTGCLVILFTNFLALVIKSGAADKDSSGSAAYSVALVIVNIMFFLSIWFNACATTKAMFSRSHAQDMLLGVDVVDESTINKVLGPEMRKTDESMGKTGGDAKTEDGEERPFWDDAWTSALHSTAGGNTGHKCPFPISAATASGQGSSRGGSLRTTLSKMAASPSEVSASEGPLRRISVDERLPTASVGLVPLEPTAEGVSPTASSPGGQTRATATTEARDGTSVEERSAST
ncbi:asn/thr-rich large protein family protein [Ectocarpus siliculosus]|uniref:Asn/thr-rich large protein family protein n=1 Tax=Ectocarpus siliculosus TaxID=2880 RepID=D7G119_ECTSI|nr:asn/thr-rich large protein family protein [Ectocarpus siliculosus]|eukprot:CBJ33129.1 asn/thr-rich large protein family protein [Ectocarpus siliculosus]